MPQTKFVLEKALKADLAPIVVINKVDKPSRRVPGGVDNEIFDLVSSRSLVIVSLRFNISRAVCEPGCERRANGLSRPLLLGQEWLGGHRS